MTKITKLFKENLILENSFGVIDKEDKVEIEVTVKITGSTYGYFEIHDTETGGDNWYASGGLWFECNKELQDYDGVFQLIPQVIELIRELGYKVSEEFEA